MAAIGFIVIHLYLWTVQPKSLKEKEPLAIAPIGSWEFRILRSSTKTYIENHFGAELTYSVSIDSTLGVLALIHLK